MDAHPQSAGQLSSFSPMSLSQKSLPQEQSTMQSLAVSPQSHMLLPQAVVGAPHADIASGQQVPMSAQQMSHEQPAGATPVMQDGMAAQPQSSAQLAAVSPDSQMPLPQQTPVQSAGQFWQVSAGASQLPSGQPTGQSAGHVALLSPAPVSQMPLPQHAPGQSNEQFWQVSPCPESHTLSPQQKPGQSPQLQGLSEPSHRLSPQQGAEQSSGQLHRFSPGPQKPLGQGGGRSCSMSGTGSGPASGGAAVSGPASAGGGSSATSAGAMSGGRMSAAGSAPPSLRPLGTSLLQEDATARPEMSTMIRFTGELLA
jgi:hypothetical protein